MSEQQALSGLLQTGIEERVASAMVLLLHNRGSDMVIAAGQAEPGTIFDLASLTKPLATALLALELESKGLLPWQSTLEQLWGSAVPEDKRDITLYQLLTHSSGYPAYQSFYKLLYTKPQAQRKPLLKAMLMNQPLARETGSQAEYSDLGYLLLGLVMEQYLQMDLASALERVYAEQGINGPRYLPLDEDPPWPKGRMAPCGPLPGRDLVHGQVEDENAHALGGVAGHAGLFGSAGQVSAVMQALAGSAVDEGPWPREKALALFQPDSQTKGSTRTVGFDTPSGELSAAGDAPPPGVAGHLGFTGTSVWWHAPTRRGVVLLTNRVIYGRDNQRIKAFRNQVHNLAWREL